MMDRSFYLWKDAAVCLQTPRRDLDSDLRKHLRYDLETQPLTSESVFNGRLGVQVKQHRLSSPAVYSP